MGKYALWFTTSNSEGVSVPHDDILNFDGGDFTISYWTDCYHAAYKTVLFKFNSINYKGWYISQNYTMAILTIWSDILSTADITTPSRTLPSASDRTYMHIAFSFDASGYCTPYMNGVAGTAIDISSISSLNCDRNLFLGVGYSVAYISPFLADHLDDIRIYKGIALSKQQIEAIYNEGRGTRVNEIAFQNLIDDGWYCDCDKVVSGTILKARKLSSGTWSDHDGTISNSSYIYLRAGGKSASANKGRMFGIKDLKKNYKEYTFFINRTGKRIQFRLSDYDGGEFEAREYKILEPEILGDR